MSSTAYTVDVEKLVRDGLASLLTGVRVLTETPADLVAQLPLVQVQVAGGFGEFTLDRVTVVLYAFGVDRDEARSLGIAARDALRWRLPGVVLAGGVITNVGTLGYPRVQPYDNTNVRRCVGSYLISVLPA